MVLKRNYVVVIVAALGFSTAGVPARANITFEAVGEPIDGGSWFQGFHFLSTAPFEYLGLVVRPVSGGNEGVGFEDPEWEFESVGGNPFGYAEVLTIGTFLTVASGDPTDELYWLSHFAGVKEDQQLVLTLFAFDGHLSHPSIQRAVARWDGTMWDFHARSSLTWEEYVAMGGGAGAGSVPIPGAAILGLLGFGLAGTRHLRGTGRRPAG